jgi:hypothetical protein
MDALRLVKKKEIKAALKLTLPLYFHLVLVNYRLTQSKLLCVKIEILNHLSSYALLYPSFRRRKLAISQDQSRIFQQSVFL